VKFVCKKDCYVRNPQGKLQLFKTGMSVDYPAGVDVADHFDPVGGEKKRNARGTKKEAGDK